MENELKQYKKNLQETNIVDYLLIDSSPTVSLFQFIDTLTKMGEIYKNLMKLNDSYFENHCNNFIECHTKILNVDFENKNSKTELVNIYNSLCEHSNNNNNYKSALMYLEKGLLVDPTNYTVHINLGFIYKCLNQFSLSLMHYRLSIVLNEYDKTNRAVSYSGISCNFRSIQNWPQALFYLLKAEELNGEDPDIQNALGIVYSEMRRTDLAESSYLKGISLAKNNKTLLENLYLNYGHMFFSNGNNRKSIELYNKVLKEYPKNRFAFQNKIMNLVYLYQELDLDYIFKQHKLINKIFPKGTIVITKNNFPKKNGIINIGIISGDFANHPVSYFISTFLSNYDTSVCNVHCYSECIIDTSIFNKNITFTLIRGMNTETVCDKLKNDKIHVLFDLSGHTSGNRIDVFAKKPVDVQVNYIGYPYSSGLDSMDYRITDAICDNVDVTQKYYTEKLLTLNNCFLCYDPLIKLPLITEKENDIFIIGNFNRLNKINDECIALYNDIMEKIPNIRFLFKTKALLNKNVLENFLKKFVYKDRIDIIDCAILHEQHLLQYNLVDISIDTFPYSGTTTTCESLLMGTPVLSLYDADRLFHPMNVSCSILKNSNLTNYICNTKDNFITKISELQKTKINKQEIRHSFLNGKVCDKVEYMKNFTKLIQSII